MTQTIKFTYYSDVLCIWAYISQARVDEALSRFADDIQVDYRFCSVFGDTAHKIENGWADRGGYVGYNEHIRKVAEEFDHISVNPAVWLKCRPVSSTPAHLMMKAVQRVDEAQCRAVLQSIRLAFFERCLDVGNWSVLYDALEAVGVSANDVREVLHSGRAYADLEADRRDQQALLVQGSPTILLHEGRQKLYGNVGYRVIEANINELFCSSASGAASWC